MKTIVFDSDGTLMDSGRVIVGAYNYIATTIGELQPDERIIYDCLAESLPIPQILERLFPGHPVQSLLEVNSRFIAEGLASLPAFEGVRELLDSLHKQGLKLAIVTSGSHRIIDIMKHHGFDHYFTSIVHGDRVTYHKPDPEGFLLAVKECGVDPTEAVMVGDSPSDIMAGKNGAAGLTIGITHGFATREQLLAADPDLIVDSITELTEVLRRRLSVLQ